MAKKQVKLPEGPDERDDEGYSRISEDDEDTELGVQRQEASGDDLRQRLGLPPCRWNRENDISASEYSDKPRPQFLGLLNRIRDNKVRSVTAYSQERITRREDEWMLFSHFCKKHHVTIYIYNRGGAIDISTATGKLTSGLFALLGAYESALISERVRNANHQRRTVLLLPSPTPVRAFGFETDGYTHRADEAEAIRRAAGVLLSERNIGAVRRFLVEESVKPVKVDRWSTPSLRAIFLRGRVAGLIEHEGEVIAEGNFEPILDRETWERCREILQTTPREPGANSRRHLLSGFLICGRCAHLMVTRGSEVGRNRRYGCIKERGGCGGVARSMRMVDPWVDNFMTVFLEQRADGPTSTQVGVTEQSLAQSIADHEAVIQVLDQEKAAGRLSVLDWVRAIKPERDAIIELNKQIKALRSARAEATEALLDPLETWRSGTLEQRRGLIRTATSGFVIKPVGRVGSRGAPPDSIEALPVM